MNRNIVPLGVVSLLTDVSSEMIYPLIPILDRRFLGAPLRPVWQGHSECAKRCLNCRFNWH